MLPLEVGGEGRGGGEFKTIQLISQCKSLLYHDLLRHVLQLDSLLSARKTRKSKTTEWHKNWEGETTDKIVRY